MGWLNVDTARRTALGRFRPVGAADVHRALSRAVDRLRAGAPVGDPGDVLVLLDGGRGRRAQLCDLPRRPGVHPRPVASASSSTRATSGSSTRIRPAMPDAAPWLRPALLCVAAVTAARLVALGFNRTDLFVDESQYWLWGQSFDFGYYSKPPLIAWVIRLSTRPCPATGSSPFGRRRRSFMRRRRWCWRRWRRGWRAGAPRSGWRPVT